MNAHRSIDQAPAGGKALAFLRRFRGGEGMTRAMMILMVLPLVAMMLMAGGTPARAAKVLVLVNDHPITDFDVKQRQRLNRLIGGPRDRKGALKALINDAVLITEARKLGIEIPDAQVSRALERMAKNMGGMNKLKAALRKAGVSMRVMRDYVRSTLLFQIMARRMGKTIRARVDEKEVERRYRKLLKDPRLQPVTIYELREVLLPLDAADPVMAQQLAYARLAEAQQIISRYRGCKSLRKAAGDIFNVKISRTIQADPRRMPKKLREALRKAGTRRLVGPMRAPNGIQLLALCRIRKITPPRPNKEQVRQMVRAEAINREVERILRQLRRKAYIEYKDKKLAVN